jgi:hypothetical protein
MRNKRRFEYGTTVNLSKNGAPAIPFLKVGLFVNSVRDFLNFPHLDDLGYTVKIFIFAN